MGPARLSADSAPSIDQVERALQIQQDRRADAGPVFELAPVREERTYEDGGATLVIKRIQDCQPFLDRNHYLREHAGEWRGDDNDFWHVASIPNMVVEEWLKLGVNVFREDHWPKVKALLNGPYKYLKTAPVNV